MTNLSPKVANEKVYFEFSKNMTNATTIRRSFWRGVLVITYPGNEERFKFLRFVGRAAVVRSRISGLATGRPAFRRG